MNELIQRTLERIQSAFALDTLATKLADWITNALVAVAVFAAFYLLWRALKLAVASGFKRTRGDATTQSFVQTLLKYGLLTIGAISALDSVGVQTSAVIASLGIAGLTLGFAAKDALSNLISGLLIFLDRPFVIGDLIEVGGHYGRVDRITLRSTRIITRDGKMLAVPNTEVINTTVASYTNYPHLRLDIAVTIAVTESIPRVRKLLLDLVRARPGYMTEPLPRVVVTALNDYNVALELQAWIVDEHSHIQARFDLREAVFTVLTEAKVDMPFETLQLAPMQVALAPPLVVD